MAQTRDAPLRATGEVRHAARHLVDHDAAPEFDT